MWVLINNSDDTQRKHYTCSASKTVAIISVITTDTHGTIIAFCISAYD